MKVELIDSVKNAIDYIINNENYETSEICVKQGSEVGDGYASKTYAISIKSKDGVVLELFVKYLPEMPNSDWKNMFIQVYQTEFHFYHEVYPTFCSFQKKRNIKEPFDNVPKYYRTNIKKCGAPPIILENLGSSGYVLRDRRKPVDHSHIKLPIQAFARYHAISYAIKDQELEIFRKLSNDMDDTFSENFITCGMDKMIQKCVDQFNESLNSVSDKNLLDRCKNLAELLIHHSTNVCQSVDEYAVIIQGDCWSNNMMFLYDNNTGLPVNVKIIDWQGQRVNSPLVDFAYFFYSIATKEILGNADYYLNLYYDTLSQRIKELGSDPEKMFPHRIFLEHWKKYSLFGLTMAFCAVKAQLFEEGETPNLINTAEPSVEAFSVVLKNQDKYISRIRDIIEHFIDKGLL